MIIAKEKIGKDWFAWVQVSPTDAVLVPCTTDAAAIERAGRIAQIKTKLKQLRERIKQIETQLS